MFILDFNATFTHFTKFIFIIFLIDQPIIAYIHDLTEIKINCQQQLVFQSSTTNRGRVFPCSVLLTGQAQKLQSQSRNIIPHKDYQLPEEEKQIYV